MTATQEEIAGSSRDVPPTGPPPGLGPIELGRWAWRQLTSMRTALLLLFLLALAAIPGSVIPQTNVDALASSNWKDDHKTLAPIYERLGLFDVFHSPWFSAIYLMLVVSLVGCIVPRSGVYWRALRSKPPAAPRNLTRLPQHREFVLDDTEAEVLERAATLMRRRRFRVVRREGAVSAERGYLREAGNLVFHISVLIVLAGVAIGNLFGYTGSVIVVSGGGFSNSLSQYDDFTPGSLFSTSSLVPFSFKVQDFKVDFIRSGADTGMAHKFDASLRYRSNPDAAWVDKNISVNHPLKVDGTNVYLLSHGYAPHITVRDGKGTVISSGPDVFLPEDDTFKSFGVVKAPDGVAADGKPEQIGLEGELYPTYAFTDQTGPFSVFPDDENPVVSMLAYQGDLGMNQPQSVYSLDKSGLVPIKSEGKQVRVDLALGKTVKLPNGLGSVTFDGISRFVKIQVSHKPFDWLALVGMSLALLGLLGSLFIRPRRIWIRVRPAGPDDADDAGDDSPDGGDGGHSGPRTLVEVAGLDRTTRDGLDAELDGIVAALSPARNKEPSA